MIPIPERVRPNIETWLSILHVAVCMRRQQWRIGAYNNFLRFRLTEDGFDVFAVGLEKVPEREDWIANPMHKPGHPNPDHPVFVPKVDLKPHLIEKVSVRFAAKQAPPTPVAVT